jgi:flagellar biogenesis protein FliO
MRQGIQARRVGLAAWLLAKVRRHDEAEPRLAVLERITLGPRQALSLVEAEGRKLLVATSQDGTTTFYSLDNGQPFTRVPRPQSARRISW